MASRVKNSKTSKSTGKPSVAKLKKKADSLWSQYIRLRDSDQNGVGTCITCGVKKHYKNLQCGHFVSRKVNLLRYDEENTNAQCYSCNVMKYGEQFQYAKALDDKYGDGTAEKLHSQRFITHKFTVEELEQVIHDAKEYIKFYQDKTLD